MDGNNAKKMTKMAYSLVGYIALLRQLASFCKGWVGDRWIQITKHSFSMDSERPRKSIHIIPGNLGSKFARDKKAKNGNTIAIYLATARAWRSLFLRRGGDRCRCIF